MLTSTIPLLRQGDQFVGRVLSLANLLSPDFALALPQFVNNTGEWRNWIDAKVELVFGMVNGSQLHEKLLEMCLASLIYHCKYIMDFDGNHCILQACPLFTTPGIIDRWRMSKPVNRGMKMVTTSIIWVFLHT